MRSHITQLLRKLQVAVTNQEGQDLIEYALVVALIAFAAISSMGTLANDINNAFVSIGTTLSTTI